MLYVYIWTTQTYKYVKKKRFINIYILFLLSLLYPFQFVGFHFFLHIWKQHSHILAPCYVCTVQIKSKYRDFINNEIEKKGKEMQWNAMKWNGKIKSNKTWAIESSEQFDCCHKVYAAVGWTYTLVIFSFHFISKYCRRFIRPSERQ